MNLEISEVIVETTENVDASSVDTNPEAGEQAMHEPEEGPENGPEKEPVADEVKADDQPEQSAAEQDQSSTEAEQSAAEQDQGAAETDQGAAETEQSALVIKKATSPKPSNLHWYIMRVAPGRESQVVEQVKANLVANSLAKSFKEITFPAESVQEDQKAKEATKGKTSKKLAKPKASRSLYPGYIFFRGTVSDSVVSILGNIPGFYGFLTSGNKIQTLSDDDYAKMIQSIEEGRSSSVDSSALAVGDKVRINSTSFKGFVASIVEIDHERETLTVSISVFKRETKVVVPLADVEKC